MNDTQLQTSHTVLDETELPQRKKARTVGIVILAVFITSYILYFSSLSFALYDHHGFVGYDLAIFDQAVWLISHGYSPYSTIRGMHVLADHFSAILYLIAPLYWIAPTPKTLLALQTIALASGAIPLYFYALLKTKSISVSLLFSVVYLLFPALQWSNLNEFFPDNLSPPFVLSALYFLAVKRWRSYIICILITLLTKEIAGFVVVTLGIYCLWIDKRKAVVTLCLGMIGILIAVVCLLYFNHGQPSAYFSLYSAHFHPTQATNNLAMKHLLSETGNYEQKKLYLLQLFWPLAFLPLLAPEIIILSTPIFLLNLLSYRTSMHSISDHYTAYLIPFLFISAINGYSRLLKLNNRAVEIIVICTLVIAVVDGTRWSPLQQKIDASVSKTPLSSQRELAAILKSVPQNASLTVSANLLENLSHRKELYTFPNPMFTAGWGGGSKALDNFYGQNYHTFDTVDFHAKMKRGGIQYIIISNSVDTFPLNESLHFQCVQASISSTDFGIIQVNRSALVLQSGANHVDGLRLFESYCHLHSPSNEDVSTLVNAWRQMRNE